MNGTMDKAEAVEAFLDRVDSAEIVEIIYDYISRHLSYEIDGWNILEGEADFTFGSVVWRGTGDDYYRRADIDLDTMMQDSGFINYVTKEVVN